MRTPSPGRSSLRCEALEARDVPAAVAESFDAVPAPWLPAGWQQAASNHQEYYAVMPTAAATGANALAVYGTLGVSSFLWSPEAQPVDVTASASIRTDTPAPILLFARGQNLQTAAAGYVGAAVSKNGAVELREVNNGVVRVVGAVAPRAAPSSRAWLRVSVTAVGTDAAVWVQRADTNQYLSPTGEWQTASVAAVRGTGLAQTAAGFAGVGRLSGDYGTAYVDDFSAGGVPVVPPVVVPPVVPTPPPVVVAPPAGAVEIPRHYSHIRVAQLAYSGTPIGATETTLLRTSVDLVVSNPQYLAAIDAAAPATPQIVYTNLSNLYGGLLTDWLNTADATGTSREAAFYHVTRPTAFTGGSPSSTPVEYFTAVTRGPAGGTRTDATSAARGGRAAGVTIGAAGGAVAVAFPDRFREVNVTLTRPAAAGWEGVWEYVSAVDTAGNATRWSAVPLVADGSAKLSADGRITFDPPADWVAARTGTDPARLFQVRVRTTAGTAAQSPEAKSLLGRDYVAANGTTTGTIPAFDAAADRDGNGYLNDAEYAARRAGFDARFASESRLFFPYYGQMRFATNPASPAVRAWAADYHHRLLAATPLADGLFVDNANGKPPLNGASVAEDAANYTAEYAAMTAAVAAAVGPKLLASNTAGTRAAANAVAAASHISVEEFLLRPTEANWTQVLDARDLVGQRLAAGPGYVVLDSHPGSTGTADPRTQSGTLAYYYLLADPDRTFLLVNGGYAPAAGWDQKWIPAAAVNVGRPTAAVTTFATGTDPENARLTFNVYSRAYENALVVFKPRSYALGVGTGTTADATATTHDLGGNYRVLNADGSTGPVVNRVTLRGGEGLTLLRA